MGAPLSDCDIGYRLYGYATSFCYIPEVVKQLLKERVSKERLRTIMHERDLILLEPGGIKQWVNQNLYPNKLYAQYGQAFGDYVMELAERLDKWDAHAGSGRWDALATFLAENPPPPIEQPQVRAA